MNRIIKFRFWTPDKRMLTDHDGWVQDIGINEALDCSRKYGYEAMQFTGLLDTNNKEVFDGDIILWGWGDDRDTGVISWSNTHFGWQIGIPAAMWKSPGSLRDFWSDRIEVIGNIHETPELLKP